MLAYKVQPYGDYTATPLYLLDNPPRSPDKKVRKIPITIPDGYTVETGTDGTVLCNSRGYKEDIVDDHGHPAIILGSFISLHGHEYMVYERLDSPCA